ncbi:CD83 antigen [Neoarius graeffei]|uniref:CD83 antigen n=1 Tax=Neoarius graeffei TaxID=443677 RepID=UPI00298C653E|nr:CD83 antigen [Neoarius graeffei]
MCLTVTAMRNSNAFSFLLLLTLGVGVRSDDPSLARVTRSICGEDALLHCWATSKPSVQYQSVTWYKVSEAPSGKLTGLVIKKLTHRNSTVRKYKGVERDLRVLEDSQSLVLPNVTLQDAGRYRCFLSAPLGHKNQEGETHLKVYEGPSEDNGTSVKEDTFYVILAITLLVVAFLMLYISYTCLKNTLLSHKSKSFRETPKIIHQMKDSIIKMESKGIVCTVLPQEYV